LIPKASARLGIVALAIALVLVPTIARARQHVERRDATRLSIRHSWIGVAPPSKASVAPQQAAIVPVIVAQPEPHRVAPRAVAAIEPPVHPVARSSDPPRGPPSES
jgi:hypothetical protein